MARARNAAPSSILYPPSSTHRARRQRGFSLTEILVVIALIVLLIALALPAFNFITGGRSVDAAQNALSAMIARARVEAIGLQEIRGVFFFQEAGTERIQIAIVRETSRPESFPPYMSNAGVVRQVEVFLDITPDSEFLALPRGVGLQTIAEGNFRPDGFRADDAYFGFNRRNEGNPTGSDRETITPYGGAILFDGNGRLISRYYALKTYEGSDPNRVATRMGDLLFRPSGALLTKNHTANGAIYDVVPRVRRVTGDTPPRSQLGVVLFDNQQFRGRPQDIAPNAPPPETDAAIVHDNVNAYSLNQEWDELHKERWLDDHGLILLVNRYNGTLVRAE